MSALRKKIAEALEGNTVLRNADFALNHKGSGQGLRIQECESRVTRHDSRKTELHLPDSVKITPLAISSTPAPYQAFPHLNLAGLNGFPQGFLVQRGRQNTGPFNQGNSIKSTSAGTDAASDATV